MKSWGRENGRRRSGDGEFDLSLERMKGSEREEESKRKRTASRSYLFRLRKERGELEKQAICERGKERSSSRHLHRISSRADDHTAHDEGCSTEASLRI